MNQKVTTNQLAIMIANGFQEVDKKFIEVNQKISQLETKVDYNHLEVMQEIKEIKADMTDYQATKANYVSQFKHNQLVQRVDVLEDKI